MVLNNVTLKDIFFASSAYDNTNTMYLIDFYSKRTYSTHYAYKLENFTFERVWDFGDHGAGIRIENEEEIDKDTAKPIKYPIDADGNEVTPKFTLDGLHADDIILDTILLLKASISVEVENLDLKNFPYYSGANHKEDYKSRTFFTSLYTDNTQIENEFQVDELLMDNAIIISRGVGVVYSYQNSDSTSYLDPLYV